MELGLHKFAIRNNSVIRAESTEQDILIVLFSGSHIGNLDLARFQHYAIYNPVLGAMESYLIALRKQRVFIRALQGKLCLAFFEPIHLAYSFKFLSADIKPLSSQAPNQSRVDHSLPVTFWRLSVVYFNLVLTLIVCLGE